jgi:hypothetical protein
LSAGGAIADVVGVGRKRMILQTKSRAIARLFLAPSFRGASETSEPGIPTRNCASGVWSFEPSRNDANGYQRVTTTVVPTETRW